MMEKISKKNGRLIIEIPWLTYDSLNSQPMDNIIGVIDGYECGFCYIIDMSYKDKPNQFSDFFFKFSGVEEEFKELCKKLKIHIHQYEQCFVCEKTIYGAHTINKKGKSICMDCE